MAERPPLALRFYVEECHILAHPEEPVDGVRRRAADLGLSFLVVVGDDGHYVGAVELAELPELPDRGTVGELLARVDPWPTIEAEADVSHADRLFREHPEKTFLVVLEDGRFIGLLLRSTLERYERVAPPGARARFDRGQLLKHLLDFSPFSFFVIDPEGRVALASRSFERYFGWTPEAVVGRTIEAVFGPLFTDTHRQYSRTNPVTEVRRSGQAVLNRERRTKDGRTFLVSSVPLPGGFVLVNQADITVQKQMEERLEAARSEAEQAFALMLPNTRVEEKLRQSPEYRDLYDPTTGRIRIVAVVPDGTYRHVMNALKITSDLKAVGALAALGVDKDVIVQTMIYHDLGKIQPRLQVGDEVDPLEVFEPSQRHAERSAAFAAGQYVQDEDVLRLIRFHHHREDELPEDFPLRLLPMLRLVQLIDGLSAAVTRNEAEFRIRLEGREIVVRERNIRPGYNGTHRLDPFSGPRRFIPDEP